MFKLLHEEYALAQKMTYTTTNQDQAVNFAGKVTDRRESGFPCVSMYEVAELEELKNKYKVLAFSDPNEDWLDFVFANRNL